MINPTSRMNPVAPNFAKPSVQPSAQPEPVKVSVPRPQPIAEEELPVEDMTTPEEPAPEVAEGLQDAGKVPEEELVTDIDLEAFFLTGSISWGFKLSDKFPVKFKMLSSDELMDMQLFLYKASKEEKSVNCVMLEQSQRILALALTQYGDTPMAKMKFEEKFDIVKKIPSVLVPILAKKYSIFENSVNKMLSSSAHLKN
jgi:hypothetical protein